MNAHISQFHLSRFLAVFSLVQSIVPVDQGFYMNFTVPPPYSAQEICRDVRGLLLLARVGFQDVVAHGNTRASGEGRIGLRFDPSEVVWKHYATIPQDRVILYHGGDSCIVRYPYGSDSLLRQLTRSLR